MNRKRRKPCPIFRFNNIGSGWEQWILLSADRHHDSNSSDLRLQREHIKQARERKALIFDFGDMYDSMQGKKDFRGSKSHLRDDLARDDYFNALVDSGVNFWKKDADLLKFICYGNHETSIIRHNEVDILKLMVEKLNDNHGGEIQLGGYQGWIRLNFQEVGKRRQSLNLWYAHGSGGAAPVTKGVIKTNRRNAMIDGADIIVSGHTHNEYRMNTPKKRLTAQGFEEIVDCLHVQIPSYKRVVDAPYGFETEKEFAPTPTGAMWLHITFRNHKYYYDAIRAQ